jgi:hypothetical protein
MLLRSKLAVDAGSGSFALLYHSGALGVLLRLGEGGVFVDKGASGGVVRYTCKSPLAIQTIRQRSKYFFLEIFSSTLIPP